MPARLPEPRARGYYDRLAEEILALCRLSRGRALVLTTSYRSLEEVALRVAPELSYPVLCQGDAPRERLLEQFREEVDSVLIATATFWQGVDIAGEALSLLVIDKLPFAPPDDPLVQARCERIEAEGGTGSPSTPSPLRSCSSARASAGSSGAGPTGEWSPSSTPGCERGPTAADS